MAEKLALQRRKEAAQKYQPEKIKLLLVAEAPPTDKNRYFYFEDVQKQDSLFRYVVRGVLHVEPTREDKAELLQELQAANVFLIDAHEMPLKVPLKKIVDIPDLVERCKILEPEAIFLIKATVYDLAYAALADADLPVVNERIPFPGSGQQTNFVRAFARAMSRV